QGDIVCLLTDGITEAMDSRLEQFGQERLEQLLVSMKGQALSSRKLLDDVTAEVRRHVNDAAQHDDMTMVVVKVLS
ncbi:MAG TPA: SpoIIE family protein phosphatase, partial [Bacteroidota bacterium]|nr:SpoIIE family protein phosphatase [Bacteroidota bacterium]